MKVILFTKFTKIIKESTLYFKDLNSYNQPSQGIIDFNFRKKIYNLLSFCSIYTTRNIDTLPTADIWKSLIFGGSESKSM